MNGFDHARKMAHLSAELIRYRRSHAPAIAAKAAIARGLWGIDVSRFLMLGLHEQRMEDWPESMGYLTDLEPGLRTINWQGNGKLLTVDKLMTAERLAEAEIPAAPLLAVVGRDERAHPHGHRFPAFTAVDDLIAFLAFCPDRVFVKPATGWRGMGVMGPERRVDGWHLEGAALSDRALATHLLAIAPPSGLLIQERLRSHRDLDDIGGHLGLGTVRINTALTVDGAEVLCVFAKIMGSQCLVDNFSGGKFGNMLARMDEASGCIAQVFGRKQDQHYLMEPVDTHPVTGAALTGFQFPLWHQALALACQAAAAFPEAPLLGADVAITDAGPLIVEMQSDWDANAAQLIMGKGLRPLLRDVVPRLALSQDLKAQAFAQMGLDPREMRRRREGVRLPRA